MSALDTISAAIGLVILGAIVTMLVLALAWAKKHPAAAAELLGDIVLRVLIVAAIKRRGQRAPGGSLFLPARRSAPD